MKPPEKLGGSECCEAAVYILTICSDCGESCELIEEPTPEFCENCFGEGEVGPFGYDFPEYKTCDVCGGGGLASDERDPDDWHDARVDR